MGSGKLLHFAFNKYGKENFEKSILYEGQCSKEEIDDLEKYFIWLAKAAGKAEYNIAKGGSGGATWGPSEHPEFRQKMKENFSKKSKEEIKIWREKGIKTLKEKYKKGELSQKGINNGNYGNRFKMPENHQKGEKNSQWGKSHSIETKNKIKESLKLYWDKKGRKIICKKEKRKVICIETNIIYDSVGHAAKNNNTFSANIIMNCNGRAKSCKGLHFSYIENRGL
jgi:group I intron endonuclease